MTRVNNRGITKWGDQILTERMWKEKISKEDKAVLKAACGCRTRQHLRHSDRGVQGERREGSEGGGNMSPSYRS